MKELILKNRTCRRFYGDKKIAIEQLRELVELARLSPSGGNVQPMKYALICTPEMNAKVYDTLRWAAYFKDWDGPVESERPTAYIILLRERAISKQLTWDDGIFCQSIYLGASEIGLGGCIIGNIVKNKLKEVINIGSEYDISLVIALGYPKEQVIIEEIGEDGDVKYWRDDENIHHVPKRKLKDLIVREF